MILKETGEPGDGEVPVGPGGGEGTRQLEQTHAGQLTNILHFPRKRISVSHSLGSDSDLSSENTVTDSESGCSFLDAN